MMSPAPEKVYIVIVTYNGLRWVERCFTSLRSSQYPVKTVVVDNASTDDTLTSIARDFPEVQVIANAANKGFGAANNQGITWALQQGADYIFLLNQDTWIFPDTVGRLVEVMRQAPGYGIISPLHYAADEVTLDASFERYVSKDYAQAAQTLQNAVYPIDFINAAAWFVRRGCLEAVGGFGDLFYHYGEDRDYVQRVRYYRYALGFVPLARIVHDRPPRRFALDSFDKTVWYYSVGSRARLADINHVYPIAWIGVWLWLLRDMAAALLRGKWFVIPATIKIFYNVFIHGTAEIVRYRRKIRQGIPFLFLRSE